MASPAFGGGAIAETTADQGRREYAYVRLQHDVMSADVTCKTGARGVIVHRHADVIGYEVEFTDPTFRVVTLTARDIRADNG